MGLSSEDAAADAGVPRPVGVPWFAKAQWHADLRVKRPKVAKLAANEEQREYVWDRLSGLICGCDGTTVAGPEEAWIGLRHGRRKDHRWGRSWSPQQISARLRLHFPNDPGMRVSRSWRSRCP